MIIILLGITTYVVQKYTPIISESIKNEAVSFAEENILGRLDKVKQTATSDSAKTLISDYLKKLLAGTKDATEAKLDSLKSDIEKFVEDDIINSEELISIKEKLK